jgi:hypothetical protein
VVLPVAVYIPRALKHLHATSMQVTIATPPHSVAEE